MTGLYNLILNPYTGIEDMEKIFMKTLKNSDNNGNRNGNIKIIFFCLTFFDWKALKTQAISSYHVSGFLKPTVIVIKAVNIVIRMKIKIMVLNIVLKLLISISTQ